jgi:hypothetical protein
VTLILFQEVRLVYLQYMALALVPGWLAHDAFP